MATILSQSSTTGFYNAPASKGLMGYMFLTCTALNIPLLAHLKKYLVCKLPEIFMKGEVWRIASTKLSFIDTKDLVCGSLLIYYFRVFERRHGSHQFMSYLVASTVISTVLEVLLVFLLQYFAIDLHPGGLLPPGPYGMIFPLFVNYFFDIPRVTQTSVLGIPITGKTLTYLLGLQICSTSAATVISALCGVVAGLMYRYNILYVRRFPWVPTFVAQVANATIGRLLASAPPQEGAVGATLELQRQQQLEMWEQQMVMDRAREFQRRVEGNDRPPMLMHNIIGRGLNNAGAPVAATEEQIQSLVDMGFERGSVINALRVSNNNVNSAMEILLQQS